MRAIRLLAALALATAAAAPAWGAPSAAPSVFEERATSPMAMPQFDPALRRCFLTEYGIGHARGGPVAQTPARIHEVCERGPTATQWLCTQGVVEKLAEQDEPAAQRVCAELRGRNAEVCREGARNKLYGVRKTGLDHYSVGR